MLVFRCSYLLVAYFLFFRLLFVFRVLHVTRHLDSAEWLLRMITAASHEVRCGFGRASLFGLPSLRETSRLLPVALMSSSRCLRVVCASKKAPDLP